MMVGEIVQLWQLVVVAEVDKLWQLVVVGEVDKLWQLVVELGSLLVQQETKWMIDQLMQLVEV